MDVFFEQLIKIPKSAKAIILTALMWLAGIVLALTIVFGVALYLSQLFVIGCAAAFGVLYLCWKWTSNFSCEFEYIFTNGDLDIDKIIAKQKRERKITLSVENTERIFKYNPSLIEKLNVNKKIVACIPDENSLCIMCRHKKEGMCLLVFSPEERMINEIKKFVPRSVLRESEI